MFGFGTWAKVALVTFSLGGALGGGYYFMGDSLLGRKQDNFLPFVLSSGDSTNPCKSTEEFGEWKLPKQYCQK